MEKAGELSGSLSCFFLCFCLLFSFCFLFLFSKGAEGEYGREGDREKEVGEVERERAGQTWPVLVQEGYRLISYFLTSAFPQVFLSSPKCLNHQNQFVLKQQLRSLNGMSH